MFPQVAKVRNKGQEQRLACKNYVEKHLLGTFIVYGS